MIDIQNERKNRIYICPDENVRMISLNCYIALLLFYNIYDAPTATSCTLMLGRRPCPTLVDSVFGAI